MRATDASAEDLARRAAAGLVQAAAGLRTPSPAHPFTSSSTRFPDRGSSRRAWLIGLLAVACLALAVQYAVKASGEDRSAFVRWRGALEDLVSGNDVYATWQYPNAPIMGLLLYPVTLLPRLDLGALELDCGALAWFGLKVLMTLLAFRLTVCLVQQAGAPFPPWAQGLTLLLAARPILGDLQHGNVNLLILLLVVGALYAFKQGRDVLAGLTLALAVACKLTPALFLPYLAWKRAWKALASACVGLGLFFVVIPSLILGHGRNEALLRAWANQMILPYVVEGQVFTRQTNQSLPGVLHRLLTASPSFYDSHDRPSGYHNLAAWDHEKVRWLVRGCGAGFLLLLALCCRTPLGERDSWRLAAEYSLVLLGMLLFSERTWKHHAVTLLVPFAVLCWWLAAWQGTRRSKAGVLLCLGLAALLMASTSTTLWAPLGWKQGAKLAQVYGAYVGAYLVLLGGLAFLLATARHEPASATSFDLRTSLTKTVA